MPDSYRGKFEAGTAAEQPGTGTRLFMNKLTPLIECSVDGRTLFSFDTGANGSEFSARYYREFVSMFRSLPRVPSTTGGAGGIKKIDVYILPRVFLTVGGTRVALHRVPVSPAPFESAMDETYGNLGRDLVAGFQSFTLDFANMRFRLGRRSPRGKLHE
ncbi:MAG: hypothetical protein ACRD4P_09990 [Bryobacteraceae bacterium]